jgi:hypothetical protein
VDILWDYILCGWGSKCGRGDYPLSNESPTITDKMTIPNKVINKISTGHIVMTISPPITYPKLYVP